MAKPTKPKSNGEQAKVTDADQARTNGRAHADAEALLAESRRQELALLGAERSAAERVEWVRERLAKWERRLVKAERRVAKWRERLDVAEADLAFQQRARAEGPAGGWRAPDAVTEPADEGAARESAPVAQGVEPVAQGTEQVAR